MARVAGGIFEVLVADPKSNFLLSFRLVRFECKSQRLGQDIRQNTDDRERLSLTRAVRIPSTL